MRDIKTRDSKFKTIKSIDRTIAWTERVKDPLVYANKKVEDVSDGETDILDYGEDKIKYVSNRMKDESIYASKKVGKYAKDKTIKYTKKGINKIKSKIHSKNDIANSMVQKEKKKLNKIMAEQGKKLAIEGSKKTLEGIKKISKATISAIKGIMAGIKPLVAILAAGGSVAIIAILVICLISILATSVFGIFFSSDDMDGNTKMKDCIVELNTEMDNKIKQLENTYPHNQVVIKSDKATWKDILSVYSVRVSNGDEGQDVISIDDDKKKILKEVFWDMNSLDYEIKTEKYESNTIGTLINNDLELSGNNGFTTLPSNPNTEEETILYIYINSKSIDYMKNKYNFSSEQEKQLKEITSDEFNNLWSSVIYGTYGNTGELADWKQAGKEWSNIKLGTTNSTIGDVGCLVTSIAILIKKANIPTNEIYPFNPGTFVIALNNSYGFDENGNLQYSAISKVVPKFVYQATINLKGKTKSEKLYELKKYYEMGYYISAEVYGATPNSQHWVAINNIDNNTITMYDPASSATSMWDKYDWNKTSQFVYFKIND